jgi:hypothetical protein
VRELFEKTENRDAAEILPAKVPDPIEYVSHREFVRSVLAQEVDLRAEGTQFITADEEDPEGASAQYRNHMNSQGSPSETVASGYRWTPATELAELSEV